MDPDLALIVGIVFACLAIPSFFSAVSDRRPPRAAIFLSLGSAALIVFAMMTKPGGYTLEQVPDTFLTVLSRFIP